MDPRVISLTRRDLVAGVGSSAIAWNTPFAFAGEAGPPIEGSFSDAQQARIIDTYQEDLGNDHDAVWARFTAGASALAPELDAPREVMTKYIDLAGQLRDEGAGREVTLLPRRVEAVPVGLSKLGNVVRQTEHAVRFVMPFLVGGPVGTVFRVADLIFKAASWFATETYRSQNRAFFNPRLLPTRAAKEAVWRSPLKGRREVEGSFHDTSLGQIFVSREETVDNDSGQRGYVIGIRKSGDIADEGTTRMHLIRLL